MSAAQPQRPCPTTDEFFRFTRHPVRLSCVGPVTVEVMEVRGHELLGSARSDWRDVVVFVPGNPGVPYFYAGFIRSLRERLPTTAGLMCCGYLGHSFENINRQVFSVQQQERAVETLIDRLLAEHGDARVHLMGHSVGAYIATRIADRLPESRLGTAMGLFGTVTHIARAPNGRMWWLLLPGSRHVAAAAASMVGWMPLGFRKWIAGRAEGKLRQGDTHYDGVVANMTRFHLVLNALYMARTEFESIRDLDTELFRRLGSKLVMYYGTEDGWVPTHQRTELEEALGVRASSAADAVEARKAPQLGPTVVLDETGAPHAFSLTHADDVAAAVEPLLSLTGRHA
eukprot:Hpha_TRINITY_DN14941_c2_g9::TRINITY_DN14941_c2_g9_i2::g.143538::m.143538